jgi:uncharacterized membrane protein YbhN (UPF0104 family)
MIQIEKVHRGLGRAILLGIISILVIVVVLGILYTFTEFHNILHYKFVHIKWISLTSGWLFMVLAIYILGFRWKALLPNNPTISGHFLGRCLSAGLLLNYAIPGPFGEMVGAYFVNKRSQIPISEALAAAVVSRIIGLFTAALGGVGCYIILPPMKLLPQVLHVLMFGILGGAVFLILILLVPQKLANVKNKTVQGLIDASRQISIVPKYNFLQAFLWSVLGHLFAFVGVYLSLDAITESPSTLGILFSYLTSTCCGVVAFLFPGSQFAWDAIFTSLLVLSTKYNFTQASIGVVVLRLEQILVMLFGVIPLMWLMKRYISLSDGK